MINYQKMYNQIMINMISENLDEDQQYEPYEGSEEDLIYIADLESQCTVLQQRIMDGAKCTLKHIAFAEDLGRMGMNDTVIDGIYLLDETTDYTQPAFVLS